MLAARCALRARDHRARLAGQSFLGLTVPLALQASADEVIE